MSILHASWQQECPKNSYRMASRLDFPGTSFTRLRGALKRTCATTLRLQVNARLPISLAIAAPVRRVGQVPQKG